MSLASRRWGRAGRRGQILADDPLLVKALIAVSYKLDGWGLGDQPLHLLEDVLDPQEAALATQELHSLKETGAHGAPGGGEAQRVDEVPRSLLLLGGEPSHGLLDGLLRPLW
jgi:hypothetical protein